MEVTRLLKCDLIGLQRVFVQSLIDKDGAACEINFSQKFRMGGGKLSARAKLCATSQM